MMKQIVPREITQVVALCDVAIAVSLFCTMAFMFNRMISTRSLRISFSVSVLRVSKKASKCVTKL